MHASICVIVILLLINAVSIRLSSSISMEDSGELNLDEQEFHSSSRHEPNSYYTAFANRLFYENCELDKEPCVKAKKSNHLQKLKSVTNNRTFKTKTLNDCMKCCDSLPDCVAWSYDITTGLRNKNCFIYSETNSLKSVVDTHDRNCDSIQNSSIVDNFKNRDYQLLVALLKEAAQLEHCLLNAYLYAACTIKSTPQEFEKLDATDGNRRAAIQFERARGWKESILLVAREEMTHLHYVQCMLRGLGERPYFELPKKDIHSDSWIFPNWRAKIDKTQTDDDHGVHIPVDSFTVDNIRRFVLYESTDALKDSDLFGAKNINLFGRLFEFETRFRIESMVVHIKDESIRKDLAIKLYQIYTSLHPQIEKQKKMKVVMRQAPSLEEFRFQSIANLYHKGIHPLYEKAFQNNWVVNNNRNLIDELFSFEFDRERVLPVGPIYRSKNLDHIAMKNRKAHHTDVKTISNIISEIVEEGEGATNFERNAQNLLDKVEKLGGADAYLKIWIAEYQENSSSPEWLEKFEKFRQSHLYRFAMILIAYQQEKKLAADVGLNYEVHRKTLNIGNNTTLIDLSTQLPTQFNACYLVMIMWLSRMYELPKWHDDKSRRHAIEMLSTWPIMSIGIRPFLELASFFPIEKNKLFSLNAVDLPQLPTHARQLHALYMSDERTETVIKTLDNLALHTLKDVAQWANEQITTVKMLDLSAHEQNMIHTRLTTLTRLQEFEKQFSFRKHGGYADTMPDHTYQRGHPESHTFEENPIKDIEGNIKKIYENVLLLRIRFAGWGRMQLSTDPDPPNEDAGCTGISMLHASDGNRRLNRALVWQQHQDVTEIVREPVDLMPKIGVNCVDITLMAAGENTTVNYKGLQVGDTDKELSISGLHELQRLVPADITGNNQKAIRIDLLEKNGYKPLLLGENHVVWRNGEPIDPFILAVIMDTDNKNQTNLIFQREVFNKNVRMINMTPMERTLTTRALLNFSTTDYMPAWAKHHLSLEQTKLLAQRGYPTTYMVQRAQNLGKVIESALKTTIEQLNPNEVIKIVSLAERMLRVSTPKKPALAWLNMLGHYGHTISGPLKNREDNEIFKTIREYTGISCNVNVTKDRQAVNSRWFIKYNIGMMDVDALSAFIFGELYIPLETTNTAQNIRLTYTWTYDINLYDSVIRFTCNFYEPFWRNDYVIDKNERILEIDKQTLVETLQAASDIGYFYTLEGFKNIHSSRQSITLKKEEVVTLLWDITFTVRNTEALVKMSLFFARQIDLADAALHKYTKVHTGD